MGWVLDLEKLDVNKVLSQIVDIMIAFLKAIGGGWATVAAAALSIFGVSALLWYLNILRKRAAKDETARKRKDAQAGNPGDNAKAERDGKKAADEIEEIIDGDQG